LRILTYHHFFLSFILAAGADHFAGAGKMIKYWPVNELTNQFTYKNRLFALVAGADHFAGAGKMIKCMSVNELTY